MGSVFLYRQHTQMLMDNLANWMGRSYSGVNLVFLCCLLSLPVRQKVTCLCCESLGKAGNVSRPHCLPPFLFLFFFSYNWHSVYALSLLSRPSALQEKMWFGPIKPFPRYILCEHWLPLLEEQAASNYPPDCCGPGGVWQPLSAPAPPRFLLECVVFLHSYTQSSVFTVHAYV